MIINLTPHSITIRRSNGEYLTIAPEGHPARVLSTPGVKLGEIDGIPIHDSPEWGTVEGLPEPVKGTIYVVSTIVASRCGGRPDVVSPGTGPLDGAIRENGQIVAVTRLVLAGLP